MDQLENCFLCKKELTGVIEVTTVTIGRLGMNRFQETSDCNWTRCKHCSRVVCKSCYRGTTSSCCEQQFTERRSETNGLCPQHTKAESAMPVRVTSRLGLSR